jgi:site-specific DNA-methyltransferase (adenine-specific)
MSEQDLDEPLETNAIYHGDAQELLTQVEKESVDLSFWSPPYFISDYEEDHTFEEWKNLISTVIENHYRVMKPGSFVVINIADTLAFKDPDMPQVQINNMSGKRVDVTKEDIEEVLEEHPDWDRYRLADYFDCSEQTIQRRLEGVNIRGGKHKTQTKVKLVGGLIEDWAEEAGFYLYDRRIWVKDPAWENSPWHTHSFRSVDESEYIYLLWKPGDTVYDRDKLEKEEWSDWASRGVWEIDSVKSNHEEMKHLKKFPPELARRVIRLLSDQGDLVMDPFAGSGTTCEVAIEQARDYLGFDVNEKAVELAKQNCREAEPDPGAKTIQQKLTDTS